MYEVIITTKYNTIRTTVEDCTSPEFKEILEQPYITGVEIHQIKSKTKSRRKEDEMARNRKDET